MIALRAEKRPITRHARLVNIKGSSRNLRHQVIECMDLPSYPKASILDFGCGDGTLLESIYNLTNGNCALFGVDGGVNAIAAANEKNENISYANE